MKVIGWWRAKVDAHHGLDKEILAALHLLAAVASVPGGLKDVDAAARWLRARRECAGVARWTVDSGVDSSGALLGVHVAALHAALSTLVASGAPQPDKRVFGAALSEAVEVAATLLDDGPEEDEDADEGDEKLVAQGGVNWKRKEKAAPEATTDGDVRDVDKSEAPRGASGGLSRKQRTKAAQMGMTPEAYLDWMQRGKVRVTVDTDARNSAIEEYRAMQKAKLQKANPRGRR